MPAVISASSMPAAIRQLMLVCFSMFIMLAMRRNLPGSAMVNMMNSIASTISGPSFHSRSLMPAFFLVSFMRSYLPMQLSLCLPG